MAAPEGLLRSPPEDVRALRRSWRSLVDRIQGLNWELEQEFRFGQRITRTDQGFVMGGTIKGGSSSMWYPTTRAEYDAYKRWRHVEGISEARDDEALLRLRALLDEHGAALVTRRHAPSPSRRAADDPEPYPGYGPLYRYMWEILSVLPERHLAREELQRIVLGGWGPDAAKASAYHEGAVMMYDFACRGARRTFLGLFLHELGHVHEAALSEAAKDRIHQDYLALVEVDAFFGIEYLLDGEMRKIYQKLVFNEFLAETYMIYVACGGELRRWIGGFPPPARAAWERVYEQFKQSFDGLEYE